MNDQTYPKIIDMGLSDDERRAIIDEVTSRAIEQIYPTTNDFKQQLQGDRRLNIYLGIDPTAPDLHVGHQSQLLKLRNLQLLGHHIILLIGDFTAMIGDPTDKSAARVKLTREQVLANAESYKQQASKILDFDHPTNPVELRYNSEWLGKMDFADVLELASEFTVQQMLERDMFQRRLEAQKPIGVHEFIYPMMQGWDSVSMDVDVEIGGSDQIFNMLVGSTLVKRHLGKQKYVIAGQLLVDPSGKKIGKTEGNMITLTDTPLDMFHKIMMWGDAITPHALELCSNLPMTEVQAIAGRLASGELSGIDGKLLLANQIVSDLHGPEAAQQARQEYDNLTTADTEVNRDLLTVFAPAQGQGIIEILHQSGLAPSTSEARRLLSGQAVRINGGPIDAHWTFDGTEVVLQVGKKRAENYRLLRP